MTWPPTYNKVLLLLIESIIFRFVVELCEPIHVSHFEVASFELFSSQPKTFRVSLSDR